MKDKRRVEFWLRGELAGVEYVDSKEKALLLVVRYMEKTPHSRYEYDIYTVWHPDGDSAVYNRQREARAWKITERERRQHGIKTVEEHQKEYFRLPEETRKRLENEYESSR